MGAEVKPGDDGSADGPCIDTTTLALPANQYCTTPTRKDLIVLHFTAGTSARGAIESWRATAAHVATAYVVERDGRIYQVFPPECWAYHLKSAIEHEQRSIGIEIVNVGPLKPSAEDTDALNWWPPGDSFRTKYCRMEDVDKYVHLASPYRGISYFATFPGPQLDGVARLVHHLCDRFDIAPALPQDGLRLECDPTVFGFFKGIATHANFRKDKWDIGPAFDWDRLGI